MLYFCSPFANWKLTDYEIVLIFFIIYRHYGIYVTYAAFTHNGFDDQERNLTFVKTAFQVLKLKFLACSMKQALFPLHKQNIARA